MAGEAADAERRGCWQEWMWEGVDVRNGDSLNLPTRTDGTQITLRSNQL